MSAATAFQRNKKAYLEEEAKLHSILSDRGFQNTFQSWLDDTIAQLDSKFDLCEQRLAELQQTVAVDTGEYWNSKTLAQHCNLNVDARRLIKKDVEVSSYPSWPDVIRLITSLNSLKTKGFITPKQIRFLELVEIELKNCVFEPRELTYITNALSTKLADETESQSIYSELAKYQNAIDELAPDLDSCEQLLEAALMNGDMAVAEDISFKQLDMLEHMLRLCKEQYPILNRKLTHAEETQRRRRWAIFRMANKDISCVIESKFRAIEACEDDLERIRLQLENYINDDTHQKKRYEVDKTESDKYLDDNKEKQQTVWNRIYDLYQELNSCQSELQQLGQLRRKEIERRLKLEEREAARRSGHQAFIKICADHARLLQDTIDNSMAAKDLAKALNDFVLDGCDNVTARYDREQDTLKDMQQLVQNHHFKRFTDFFLACRRLLYRKEKRMDQVNAGIDENECMKEMAAETFDPKAKKFADDRQTLLTKKTSLADEILALRQRLDSSERDIAPTLQSFSFANIPFVHPADIAERINVDRAERVLDYREIANFNSEKQTALLKDEEDGFQSMRQQATTKRIPAAAPKPPSQSQHQQYKRFQELLEKKLDAPTSTDPQRETDSGPGGGRGGDKQIQDGAIVRALYRYAARAADELTFEKGDTIVCVSSAAEEGWYHGVCNQKTGLFPGNYVTGSAM